MKKPKIVGMFVLALFLLSITSAVADIEVPPEEEVPVEPTPVYFCDDVRAIIQQRDFDLAHPDFENEEFPEDEPIPVKPICNKRPVVVKSRGHGGFYIGKGKTMFGMTSKYVGSGFGIPVNRIQAGKKLKLNLPSIGLVELSGKTLLNKKPNFVYGFHIKTLKPNSKDTIASYELLSNLGKDIKMKVNWRVSSKEDVVFLLNGNLLETKKLASKSKSQSQYEVTLTEGGVIELVKAKYLQKVNKVNTKVN